MRIVRMRGHLTAPVALLVALTAWLACSSSGTTPNQTSSTIPPSGAADAAASDSSSTSSSSRDSSAVSTPDTGAESAPPVEASAATPADAAEERVVAREAAVDEAGLDAAPATTLVTLTQDGG